MAFISSQDTEAPGLLSPGLMINVESFKEECVLGNSVWCGFGIERTECPHHHRDPVVACLGICGTV